LIIEVLPSESYRETMSNGIAGVLVEIGTGHYGIQFKIA
jgi:hypothetical protein